MEVSGDVLVSASEFIKDRLYFVTLKTTDQPKSTQFTHFFSIEGQLTYDSFFDDFGPLNISMLYHYCTKLNLKLSCAALEKKKIVHTTTDDYRKRANAAYLIGSYAIIYLNWDAQKAYDTLVGDNRYPFIHFRDASNGPDGYTISLLDCLKGLEKAFHFGFFDFTSFNYLQYEHYECVENGDLNWIVPEKFLGFCGPHNKSRNVNGYPLHSPEFYFKYFQRHNVTTIIRLNKRIYDSNKFLLAGFQHYDLYFVDGSTPTVKILNEFMNICEKTDGAIAVHCKAGLGRTGTLIGCYLMKHYQFSSHEAIAWIRICRPGSVIGHQQEWLDRKQEQMWKEGEAYRRKRGITSMPKHRFGIYSKHAPVGPLEGSGKQGKLNDKVTRILKKVDTMQLNDNSEKEDEEDGITQGDRLNQIKAKRQCHVVTNPSTFRSQMLVNTVETTSAITRVSKVLCTTTKAPTPSISRVLVKRNEVTETTSTVARRLSQRKVAAALTKTTSGASLLRNGKPKVVAKKNENNGWTMEEMDTTCSTGGEKKTVVDVKVTKRVKRTLNMEKDKATSPRSVKVQRRSHASNPSESNVKSGKKIHLPLMKVSK
ncbi:dual specificity protein phosphatase CDC14C-like isoform X2 [Onthophagus taurus]|uniref:dual specificity protein phosphatase CDC14C-like isoform X2 n=1 Tax=Onthophagus taurus TaxID=166361 RepID=UPI000C203D61|nr:dual specificity protein phosphatase CDC14B-like isoform X2 [Onthophagus taurus]